MDWLLNGFTDLADSFFFCCVRNCQEKVVMKENFRIIHWESRKYGCQKFNSGAICPGRK